MDINDPSTAIQFHGDETEKKMLGLLLRLCDRLSEVGIVDCLPGGCAEGQGEEMLTFALAHAEGLELYEKCILLKRLLTEMKEWNRVNGKNPALNVAS